MKKTASLLALAGALTIALGAHASETRHGGEGREAGARMESHERSESRERLESGEHRAVMDADIVAKVEAEGYEVLRQEREHGRVEIKARRDGRYYEIEVNPLDGRILRVEEDD